jgi:hypothetical protein
MLRVVPFAAAATTSVQVLAAAVTILLLLLLCCHCYSWLAISYTTAGMLM